MISRVSEREAKEKKGFGKGYRGGASGCFKSFIIAINIIIISVAITTARANLNEY